MAIEHAHSYLVHPGRGQDEQRDVSGVAVPTQSAGDKVTRLVASLFDTAEKECNLDILFRPDSRGARNNPCQKLFESYVKHPSLANGKKVAVKLRDVTTHRSGLGLLFLLTGTDSYGPRLVVARFPAEQGVVADESPRKLTVKFIDRVFMKNAHAYKCATYVARAGFSDGKAVDKQINDPREISDYWIFDFLESDFRTTSAAGSANLGDAVRKATSLTDGPIRSELIVAAQMMRNQHGRVTSPAQLASELRLSAAAGDAIRSSLPTPALFTQKFRFNQDEFDRHAAFRAVELNNGATLIADNSRFDEVFRREAIGNGGKRRFVTEGEIITEKLRKRP